MSRRTILAMVTAIAVLAAGLGWFAGQRIKSPADIAAEAQPPEASLITVPVEQRDLSSNIVMRGQVAFTESTDISITGSADGVAIVTRLPKAEGEQLAEGDVVVEVAGRPVIVLQGELPVFRSLTPTLEGPDVRQLEESLVRLGFDPGPVDGIYDAATEAAVVELYRDAGYKADEPTADEIDRVEQARRTLREARTQLADAKEGSSAAGLPQSTRLELDRAVTNAEENLTLAKETRDREVGAAWADTEAARNALTAAQTAKDTAQTRLDAAVAGTHPDTGVAPTPEELTELTRVRDEADVTLAEATTAESIASTTETDVKREQDSAVRNAEIDLEVAKASRTESITQANETGGQDGVTSAQESVRDAEEALARLEAETGVSFPASELIFLPNLPAEVQALRADVGDVPQGPVMTVTGSGLKITGTISAADRSLLTEGAAAIMEDDELGIRLDATVAFVADNPGGPDVAADRYAVRLEPVGEVPEDAINQNLRVTIPFASTDGEVLAVPLAALSAGADGSSRVEVERADGTVETVTVVPGLNARALGLVEITPVDGNLEAGDRVVVGRNVPVAADEDDGAEDDADSEGSDDGGSEDEPAEVEGEDEG